MGKLKQWFDNWLGGGEKGTRKSHLTLMILVAVLVGAALMILSSFLNVKDISHYNESRGSPREEVSQQTFSGKEHKEKGGFREYEEAFESRLKELLQKIAGVGEPEVMVNIESTEETIVEKNTKESNQTTSEKDTNGGSRNISEITRDGQVVLYQVSGDQKPLVLKYIKPKIRGVLVVAKGAENMTVKRMISEAVERSLDVPAQKISILPKKQS